MKRRLFSSAYAEASSYSTTRVEGVEKGTLQGQCHEMNNFLKALKTKLVLSVYAPMVVNFLHLQCLEMYF